MKKVTDESFKKYGRILDLDTKEFVEVMMKKDTVMEGTVYKASDPDFEQLPLFTQLQKEVYGDVPIEFGYCNGRNNKLNAVEYHRCSEIDIAATDLILMLGCQQDINYANNTYETEKIEQFFIPAGTAVELYATTLHFAPSRENNEEFRCGIVLIKDTNLPLETKPTDATGENRLLFARNKWLICHSESKPAKNGGCIGLIGKNLEI
ncbi:Uncharacterised protein [Megamonas hypermegale]|uniref:DUF4867 domain-containing protein n=1 Tax=Megamonas hypermegale TaxID=158847 RepID=A0A239TE83_9FIRM|nr:DUF4867 family protein [Megamonas hypermegale]SNU95889.1 Uncharacterised protein [Megamonas hypermegale]